MASEDIWQSDAAWRERLDNFVAVWPPQHLGAPVRVSDVVAVLAALADAEAERDQQTALVCRWDERDHEKTVQLARLAALEAAARRLAGHHGPVHCNCQTCRQFRDAVAALDAPPGESP